MEQVCGTRTLQVCLRCWRKVLQEPAASAGGSYYVQCTEHGHGRRMGFSAPVAVVCLDGLVSGSGCPSRAFVASVCCAFLS